MIENVLDLPSSDLAGKEATVYVALDPAQIKSINNRGAFDPNDARVLYSRPHSRTSGDIIRGAGAGVNAVKKWVEPLLAKAGGAKTSVVASIDDLPDHIRTNAQPGDRGYFHPATGQTWLIADAIPDEATAIRTWLHENALHRGLRALIPDHARRNRVLSDVADHYGDEGLADIADAYGFDLSDPGQRLEAAEERLALLAESILSEDKNLTQEEKGLWKQVVDAIRSWMRELGLTEISEREIAELIHSAHRAVMEDGGQIAESSEDAGDILYRRNLSRTVSDIIRGAAAGDESIVNNLDKKDVGLLSSAVSLPYWLAKRFPDFGRIVERQLQRMEDRQRALAANLEEVPAFFGDKKQRLDKREMATLRDLIWKIDGKKIKSITADKFSAVKDDNGVPVRVNGRTVLEVNPEFNRQYKAWLDKLNVPARVRDALLQVRSSLDADLLRAYDVMIRMGDVDDGVIADYRKQINHVHNYFPHKRYGGYFIQAVNKAGEVLYREHFDAVTKLQAHRIANKKTAALRSQYPADAIWSKGKVKRVPEEAFSSPIPQDAMEQILSAAADRIGDEETRSKFKNVMARAVSDVLKSRGWGSHAIGRKGVPGHETEDIARVLYDYKSGLSGWLTKLEASRDFTQLLSKINAKERPGEWTYAANYVEDMLRNYDNVDRIVGNVKALAFAWYLGANIKTAALNLTQNLILGTPTLGMYVKGPALTKYMGGAGKALAKWTLNPEEKRLVDELFKEGVVTDNFLKEIRGHVTGSAMARFFDKAIEYMGLPMSVAERFNRASLALAAFNAARDGKVSDVKTLTGLGLSKGEKADFDQAKKFASQIVNDAHFVYGRTNLPQAFRHSAGGRFASSAYTFRTFSHNLISAWAHMLRSMGQKGAKAFVSSLAATAMIGGVSSIPLYHTLMALYQVLFDDDDDWTEEIRKALPENELVRDIVIYGVPSVAGVNLGGSVGMETPVLSRLQPGDTPMEALEDNLGDILGIPYDLIFVKSSRAWKAYKAGDMSRAVEAVAPTFVKNMMQAYRLHTEGQTSISGKQINDPGEKGARKISAGEAVGKMIGFQPVSSSKSWDKYRARQVSRAVRSEVLQNLASRYIRARRDNDRAAVKTVMDDLREHNRKAKAEKKRWLIITLKDLSRSAKAREKNPTRSPKARARMLEQRKAYTE